MRAIIITYGPTFLPHEGVLKRLSMISGVSDASLRRLCSSDVWRSGASLAVLCSLQGSSPPGTPAGLERERSCVFGQSSLYLAGGCVLGRIAAGKGWLGFIRQTCFGAKLEPSKSGSDVMSQSAVLEKWINDRWSLLV